MALFEPAYALFFTVFSAGRLRLAAGRGAPRGLLAAEALVALLALTGFLVHRLGYADAQLGGLRVGGLWLVITPLVIFGYGAFVPQWLRSAEIDPEIPEPRRALIYFLAGLIILAFVGPALWSNVALGLGLA